MFWDWTKDAIDTADSAPVQMQQQPDLLAAALEAKGVSADKAVVVSKAKQGRCCAAQVLPHLRLCLLAAVLNMT